MICPYDRTQMVNFEIDKDTKEVKPLPSGGVATDELYETWYEYHCPECGRKVIESYRCEVLTRKEKPCQDL